MHERPQAIVRNTRLETNGGPNEDSFLTYSGSDVSSILIICSVVDICRLSTFHSNRASVNSDGTNKHGPFHGLP